MKGMTKKQSDMLRYITHFIEKKGYSPSYREIMRAFDLNSPGTVYKHLQALKRKQNLFSEKHCSRSLSLEDIHSRESPSFECELPYIGYISANSPVESFPQTETIHVPPLLVPNPDKTYVLQVQGDFLLKELIADGDLLLVEVRSQFDAGSLVLARVNNHAMVVKRYYAAGTQIRLEGHYDTLAKPIDVLHDEVQILGAVAGIIRLSS
jgi:repressor LexA